MKDLGGRYRSSFLQRVRRAKKRVEKNTQALRVKLLEELEGMFALAKEAVKAENVTVKEAQNWMRIIGYLSQVMNSLSKSFDEAKALQYLKNLERMMRESKKHSEESQRN
ncbi:MAG: hypothetical protein K6T73_08075 [Candidatus Bathyarchaeota archaeon]|nr:hypothetical protein [Candidatus Bathyarchaeota archaeon]